MSSRAAAPRGAARADGRPARDSLPLLQAAGHAGFSGAIRRGSQDRTGFPQHPQAREHAFYDHLVSHLFQNVLHRYQHNLVYFAKRGSRDRQAPLSGAIQRGIGRFEEKWGTQVTTTFKVQAQTPAGEPCLSVADYMNWAVYRAYTGDEMRYFGAVQHNSAYWWICTTSTGIPTTGTAARTRSTSKKPPLCS